MSEAMESKNSFQNKTLNKIMVASSIAGVIGLILLFINKTVLGVDIEAIVSTLILLIFIILTFFRFRMTLKAKVITLITASTLIGIIGSLFHGMLSPTIFCLPIASILISIFFKKIISIIYFLFSFSYLFLLLIGFSSGRLRLDISADTLITSSGHWMLYITSFSSLYLIFIFIVHSYRNFMDVMIEKTINQRDELDTINKELRLALMEVKELSGLLPICAHCKKIRDGEGYWKQIESYIETHTNALFSHGLCDPCAEELYGDQEWYKKRKKTT